MLGNAQNCLGMASHGWTSLTRAWKPNVTESVQLQINFKKHSNYKAKEPTLTWISPDFFSSPQGQYLVFLLMSHRHIKVYKPLIISAPQPSFSRILTSHCPINEVAPAVLYPSLLLFLFSVVSYPKTQVRKLGIISDSSFLSALVIKTSSFIIQTFLVFPCLFIPNV